MRQLTFSPMLLAILPLLALLAVRPAAAVSWNLKRSQDANLTAWYGLPEEDAPDCTYPGICKPLTLNLRNGTLWYWCGWKAQQRTQYWISVTSGANVTALLMRNSEFFGCALANLTGIKACGQIDNSICDTQGSCDVLTVGLAFPDDVCLLVSNNDKAKNSTLTLQMWQYYDRPRYYGTVFTVIYTVVFALAMITFLTISCTKQYRAPHHRLDELMQLDAQQPQLQSPLIDGSSPAKGHEEEEPGQVSSWLSKTKANLQGLLSKRQKPITV